MTSQLVANVAGRLPQWGEFAPGAPTQANPKGHNGDCVEYSYMVARAAAQPWCALDGAELDRLTNESIGAGEAGPAGQMTNANLAWLCSTEGAPYTQITTGDLIATAQEWAGRRPLCMGFANGQALPGNEQGVFGHCVAVLDWDGSVFTLANGDSTNGEAGRLDTASPAQLAAAQPSQVTRLELDTMTVQPTWDAAAGTLTYPAHDGLPQIVLDHGQAWYAHGSRPGVYPLLPAFYEGDNSVVLWSDAQKSVAVKANNWAVQLASAAADLAAAWQHGSAPAVDVAGIKADLTNALAKLGG